MRYYWEVLFSTEYFPYWEFTMLMMLALQISHLWRLHRIEEKVDIVDLAIDSMSGLTSQPAFGSIVSIMKQTHQDPQLDEEAIRTLSLYW